MASQVCLFVCTCLALFSSHVEAVSVDMPRNLKSEAQRIASLPMRMYKKDCWRKRPVSLIQHDLPGAGLEKITPFETVLKDGYLQADCVKDYMYHYGDKFGKNKAAYDQALISNVSIVHYNQVVPAEDRESMTQAVCFAFCRTVPDMLFFGIANGRTCYCAPYYKQMADDDSTCDSVCEGESTQMCGGKSKSSMFAMHTCASTASDLTESSGKMEGVQTDLSGLVKDVDALATDLQTAADELQPLFSKIGDSGAGDLLQQAKVFAGELEKATEGAKPMDTDMTAMKASSDSMAGADFTVYAKANEAEQLIDKMDELTTAGTEKVQELEDLKADAGPEEVKNASMHYYPVMYFVNNESYADPATCTGDVSAKPSVASRLACASACDAQVGTCVGFQYFESASVTAGGICFLFSKMKSVQYYTGCKGGFLQAQVKKADPAAECKVKFSEFEGTTLKPDPSGKCKICLREATEAKRCFK